jgi:ADP-ribosylglycohydrolase
LYERLWFPEKYPAIRIRVSNADPRSAGVGNCVNCGVAMWMMPAGAVNAGNPARAYQEGAAIGMAHNESYAVEAGAVMAAAYAAAFSPKATVSDVLTAAQHCAREGTGAAIRACLAAVKGSDRLPVWIRKVRRAMEPYDARVGHVADDKPLVTRGVNNVGLPSHLHAIEELPVALAALKYGGTRFGKVLKAAVFYGRDCDSIASMAAGLYGAVYGAGRVPSRLKADADRANGRDFARMAARFTSAVRAVAVKDQARFRQHLSAVKA